MFESANEKFRKGFQVTLEKLEDTLVLEPSVHVTEEMIKTMLRTLETTDITVLVDSLVNIYIQLYLNTSGATNQELLKTLNTTQNELYGLKIENKWLTEQLETTMGALQTLQATNKQRVLVQNGQKISYNEDVQPGAVLDLLRKGMSVTKIAEHFGVSRNLIYRRINELKEAGIDLDTLNCYTKSAVAKYPKSMIK